MVVSWYPAAASSTIVVLLAMCAFLILGPSSSSSPGTVPNRPFQIWHAVALVSLSLVPLIGMIVAQVATHAFADRYAIAAIPGICILLIAGIGRASGYSTRAAAVLWVVTLMCFAGLAFRARWNFLVELSDLRATAALLRPTEAGRSPFPT